MDIYKQKNVNDKLVAIVGWNKKDVILVIYGTDTRFAMNWDLFLQHYEKLDPFECDTNDYEGADLTNR